MLRRGCAVWESRPGDRVLLQLPNGCQFAVALFGLLRARAMPVMCLPGHRAAELGHFAAVGQATGLLIADAANGFDYRAMARELVADHATLKHVIVDGDPGPFLSWTQLCGAATLRKPRPVDGTAGRSGITGAAAGFRRHHRPAQTHPPHAQRLRVQRDRERRSLPAYRR